MPSESFRIGLVQMSCGPEPEENLQQALARVEDASNRGARVVCLPELFQTQYFCQREDASLFDLAEPIPGRTTERLAAAARKDGIVLIASLFEKRAPGIYHNTAAVFDADGTLRGIYRKMHIPDDPLYYEKFYFTPGDLGFRAIDIRGQSAPGAGLEFWGGSFICDPFGRVIAESSNDKEEILLGEVDLRKLEETRRNWPFLRDRRVDSYAPITNRLLD